MDFSKLKKTKKPSRNRRIKYYNQITAPSPETLENIKNTLIPQTPTSSGFWAFPRNKPLPYNWQGFDYDEKHGRFGAPTKTTPHMIAETLVDYATSTDNILVVADRHNVSADLFEHLVSMPRFSDLAETYLRASAMKSEAYINEIMAITSLDQPKARYTDREGNTNRMDMGQVRMRELREKTLWRLAVCHNRAKYGEKLETLNKSVNVNINHTLPPEALKNASAGEIIDFLTSG
jgi:hypothetical protein